MFSLTSILSVSCECHGNQVQSSYLEPLQYSQDTISAKRFGIRTNAVFEVRDTVDLMGKTLWLPQGVLIKHHRGGVISNGVLRGNKTQIESKGDLFNRVKIEGTWEVSIIKSSLFKDLDYDNSLQDVVALSNASIHNTISIEAGEYQLSVKSSGGVGLLIQSNTDVELNGIIRLVSNSFDSYCVLRLAGKDIKVEGNCHVFGDRFTHTGKNGEWGMGVSVAASKVVIKGICIGDCWGDCIYIGTKLLLINAD